MAMGRRGRDEADRAIRSCRPFTNSTGSMRGTRGSTLNLGWLSSHADKLLIKDLLCRATYVVWSYDTPIGFVSEDEDGDVQRYYVDEHHTRTTSHHQGILRVAWGEYEVIGERRPARRPRRQPSSAFPPGLLEREPITPVPADSPGYPNGLTENQQERTLAQLLDSRFSDPDWVPGRDWDADYQAELRDIRRVEQERTWRP